MVVAQFEHLRAARVVLAREREDAADTHGDGRVGSQSKVVGNRGRSGAVRPHGPKTVPSGEV